MDTILDPLGVSRLLRKLASRGHVMTRPKPRVVSAALAASILLWLLIVHPLVVWGSLAIFWIFLKLTE